MKELVKEKVLKALKELYNTQVENFKVEKPKEEAHGDLASNVAFLLARELKKPPVNIAQELADFLSKDETFKSVEAVKGFINFRFSEDFLKEEFKKFLLSGEAYFKEDLGKGLKVQLEYVSANPTGPLHLGHGRGAVVGDTLARLFKFFNYDVTREYYINDAGRQVYLLGISIYYRYLEKCPERDEETFKEIKEIFEKDGYRGEYVKEIAERLRKLVGESLCKPEEANLKEVREKILKEESIELYYTKKYEPKDVVDLLSNYGLDLMMKEIREDLSLMDISFDVWFSERSLYDSGEVERLINLLKEKGYVYEKDGALWLKTSLFGDDKDRVVKRSDGTYTYFASDIAYHYNKFKRGFEKVINVWGADHHGYIPRVKAALKMLEIPEDWLEILLVQMVKLFREGKEVKMSKRAGTFVTLRELLDEVGKDAVRFIFLTKRSDTPLDFDVEKAKEKSSENPVYYVQYAHARISGIFREFKERYKKDVSVEELINYVQHLEEEAEIKLIKKVLFFKDELVDITLKREPHLLTYYLIDLAGDFHHYYNHHRILGMEENVMFSRLALVKGIKEVVRLGLNLMGVSAPERM
ncbi:arginine--tRNA ligase [Aquifex aeolicus]|uniref:Arginine--tRNA ligase n=1 Tax=Aquifex aeolicus (strain VF5) TaxID=224324 RepID=SYR_AQUAE|nr:arginine--tRNA ligase [Aquifex aeolicus]O67068.1 RecName: Full=Arginine--tRNA ligase; AltName: Full=Arginyl-tRNA synthetase; Short=ArgRS [Aquifex aeolicus VF5]AAC07033.1 arginyl-tRNA synthetase [Aquifex aeolicus VF5]